MDEALGWIVIVLFILAVFGVIDVSLTISLPERGETVLRIGKAG